MINIEQVRGNLAIRGARFVLYLLVSAGAIVFAIPFLWMVRTSIMPSWQVIIFPPQWIPAELHWANWRRPFELLSMGLLFKNTVILTAFNITATLLSNLPVAYGFARLRFPGRGILFLILLATMMLPRQVTMIPRYVLFSKLGWINTFKPLIVPTLFGNAFTIFLLRQFFMTIPLELDDAAKIDGCGIFGIFWRIVLPLSRPAMGIVTIMAFTSNWNDFMGPLIYLWDRNKFTIALGLQLFKDTGMQHFGGLVEMEALMAATIMALAPVLVVFFLAQKHFVQGIVITGVKG
jgi:multiple sugar transport system permease protein